MKLALILLPFMALSSWGAEENPATSIYRIETEIAAHIQTGILDPVLGVGRSSVFVRLGLTVERRSDNSGKDGTGRSTSTKLQKPPLRPDSDVDISSNTEIVQVAQQVKSQNEEKVTTTLRFDPFDVVILHDANIPQKKLDEVRAALKEAYQPDVKLTFKKMEFHRENREGNGPPPN